MKWRISSCSQTINNMRKHFNSSGRSFAAWEEEKSWYRARRTAGFCLLSWLSTILERKLSQNGDLVRLERPVAILEDRLNEGRKCSFLVAPRLLLVILSLHHYLERKLINVNAVESYFQMEGNLSIASPGRWSQRQVVWCFEQVWTP